MGEPSRQASTSVAADDEGEGRSVGTAPVLPDLRRRSQQKRLASRTGIAEQRKRSASVVVYDSEEGGQPEEALPSSSSIPASRGPRRPSAGEGEDEEQKSRDSESRRKREREAEERAAERLARRQRRHQQEVAEVEEIMRVSSGPAPPSDPAGSPRVLHQPRLSPSVPPASPSASVSSSAASVTPSASASSAMVPRGGPEGSDDDVTITGSSGRSAAYFSGVAEFQQSIQGKRAVRRVKTEPVTVKGSAGTPRRKEGLSLGSSFVSVMPGPQRPQVGRSRTAESLSASLYHQRRREAREQRRKEIEDRQRRRSRGAVEEVEEILRSSSAEDLPASVPEEPVALLAHHLRSLSAPFRGTTPPPVIPLLRAFSSPDECTTTSPSSPISPAGVTLPRLGSSRSGPTTSGEASPSSPFPAVRPSRDRRASPATSGLVSVNSRVLRPTAEGDVRVALSGVPARARQQERRRGGFSTSLVPGPRRAATHPLEEHADDGSYRNVWRELLLRRLQRGSVRLSAARNEDDPLSEAGSDDERYEQRVMELEWYRSRPAAPGGQAQWVTNPGEVTHVLRPWNEDVPASAWHRQPRGVVSEWFPFP